MRTRRVRHHSTTRAALALTGLLCSAGCGDDDVTVIAPTPPVPVTDTVSGTITPFSARIHPFGVQNPGAVSAILTELAEPDPDPDPDKATTLGLDIGTLIGSACQVVVSRTDVAKGQSIVATATAAGNLCVRVFDPTDTGLPMPLAYTIAFTHF